MANKYLTKLQRSFYETSKVVFNAERTRQQTIDYRQVLAILYLIRLLFAMYIMANNFPTSFYDYHHFDFWLHYFYLNREHYDAYLIMIFFLFGVFYCACEMATSKLNTQTITWHWWYQLVVENEDWYYECSLEDGQLKEVYQQRQKLIEGQLNQSQLFGVLIPELLKQLMAKWLAILLVFFKLEDIDRERYLAKRLSIMPHLSAKNRQKTIVAMIVCDYVFYIVLVVIFIGFWGIVLRSNLTYPDWSLHPWPVIILAQFEVLFIFIPFIRMLQFAQFFVVITIIGTIHYTTHVIEMRRAVERVIRQAERAKSLTISPINKWLVKLHLWEHNKVCYLVMRGSVELFGSIMYTFLLTNIPINIYLISWVIFKKRQLPLDQALIWIFSLLQISVVLTIFLPLAWCCVVYHSPAKFIPKLQHLMSGQLWRRDKFKYDDLYNRLSSGPKIAISIGFRFNPITYLSFSEFIYTYVAYLLLAFSQMLEYGTNG